MSNSPFDPGSIDAFFGSGGADELKNEGDEEIVPGVSRSLAEEHGTVLAVHKTNELGGALLCTSLHSQKGNLSNHIAASRDRFATYLQYNVALTNFLIELRSLYKGKSFACIAEVLDSKFLSSVIDKFQVDQSGYQIIEAFRDRVSSNGEAAYDIYTEGGANGPVAAVNFMNYATMFHAYCLLQDDVDFFRPGRPVSEDGMTTNQRIKRETETLARQHGLPNDEVCNEILTRWQQWFIEDHQTRHAFMRMQADTVDHSVVILGSGHFRSLGKPLIDADCLEDAFADRNYAVVSMHSESKMANAMEKPGTRDFNYFIATPDDLRALIVQTRRAPM